MTVDHVVFNRNRYMIRCEQQNWLFHFFFCSFYLASWTSCDHLSTNAIHMRKRARYKDDNWRSSIVWTLLSLYIWALVKRKTELERWSMTCEYVYTLKLNVYEHMYALGHVSFSISFFFFVIFFLLDNQLIMINDSKRCWSIKKVVGHINNIIRKKNVWFNKIMNRVGYGFRNIDWTW
jgi:hypothetical protein